MCVYNKAVIMPYSIQVKKSGSVTNEQFNSGKSNFRMISHRTKVVGSHKKFEEGVIIEVYLDYQDDYYGNYRVMGKLDNEVIIDLLDL